MNALVDELNSGLAMAGESVSLRRLATPPATGFIYQVDCLAVIRGYSPSELAAGSGITQEDQKMILSPTALTAAGWPGVPRRGDRVVTNRGVMTVQAAAGLYVQDALVRIELTVRGA